MGLRGRVLRCLLAVWGIFAASEPLLAVCSVANTYSFNFASQGAATLAYGTTYTYTATSTALGNQNFTVGSTQNGLTSIAVGGQNRPNISNSHNGGGASNALVIGGILAGRTASIIGATRVMVTTMTFASPVRDISVTVHDVDFGANQFRDWFHVSGTNGVVTYTPTLTTPFSQANGTGPFTNASSSLTLGPNTTGGITATVNQAVGLSVSGNNSATGNINISFAQPVTSVTLRYGNYPLTGTETTTGQQAYAISAITWCPMPSVTVVKSSTPVETTGSNRFHIPGADVYYTITVANSNSSPVDAGSIVIADPLPADLQFFNGDMDGAGPITGNFEFIPGTSGLSLTSANITYSLTAAGPFTYTPPAGYAPLVRAIRFAPTNEMASNSSFSVRFRARIKPN